MKCHNSRESITQYLLGELDPEQNRGLEEHLQSCAKCRADADRQRATLSLLRESLAAPCDAPESLDAERREEILESLQRKRSRIIGLPAAFGIPLRVAALFMLGIALFLVVSPMIRDAHMRRQLTQTAANGRNIMQTLMGRETENIYTESKNLWPKSGRRHKSRDAASSAVAPEMELAQTDDSTWGSDYDAEVGMKEFEMRMDDKESVNGPLPLGEDGAETMPPSSPKPKPNATKMPAPPSETVDASQMDIRGNKVVLNGLFAGRSSEGRAQVLHSYGGGGGGAKPGSKEKMVPLEVEYPEPVFQGTPVPIDLPNLERTSMERQKNREENRKKDAVHEVVKGKELSKEFKTELEDGLRQLTGEDKSMLEKRKASKYENADELEEESAEIIARAYGVNPFIETGENAFSTFGIDCDTASYTMARNLLRQGRLPPPDTVRTEEFVNFFDYRYSAPRRRLFSIYSECAPSPFGRGLHLLDLGIKGRRLGRDQQRPAQLTFAIDSSGSMNTEDRIGLVRLALERLLDQLAPQDEVAIVSYGSRARLMLEHTPVSQKQDILNAIRNLRISGSTHLEAGLLLAYRQAAANFRSGAVNRVIMLSDGRANLGSDSAEQILAQIEEYRRQGIYCSVFGFGTGNYNDELLETLANKGDGSYAFIDGEQEVERIFVKDLAATLHVIAKDAKIQVEFDPRRVVRYRQIGYENRRLRKQDFRNDGVDAGEVGSGQSVSALYEVELTGKSDIPLGIVRVRAFDTHAERIVEIDAPIDAPSVKGFAEASERFRLAAAAAELAEILRNSPHAAGSGIGDVLRVARPLAQELNLDQKVQELVRMLNAARGLK